MFHLHTEVFRERRNKYNLFTVVRCTGNRNTHIFGQPMAMVLESVVIVRCGIHDSEFGTYASYRYTVDSKFNDMYR